MREIPVGARVAAEAVSRVDGQRIEFSVRAADDNEEIGVGTHERMIVDVARLTRRLDAKRASIVKGT
jgi:fluoroacetyl-CoA thioesterase